AQRERAARRVERHAPAHRIGRTFVRTEQNRIRVEGGEAVAARELARLLRVVPEIARGSDVGTHDRGEEKGDRQRGDAPENRIAEVEWIRPVERSRLHAAGA